MVWVIDRNKTDRVSVKVESISLCSQIALFIRNAIKYTTYLVRIVGLALKFNLWTLYKNVVHIRRKYFVL